MFPAVWSGFTWRRNFYLLYIYICYGQSPDFGQFPSWRPFRTLADVLGVYATLAELSNTDQRNVFVFESKKEEGIQVPRCLVEVEGKDLLVPVTNVKEVEAEASGSAWSADVEVGRKEDGLSRKPRMCCKREESMQCCEKRSRVLTRARGQGLTDQVTASDMQRNSDLGLCPREVTRVVPDGDGPRDAASRKGGSEVTQSERAAPASDGTSADRPKGSMEDNMSGTSLEGREMEEQWEQKEAEANEVVSEGSSVCVLRVPECNPCVLEEQSGKKETETNEVVSDSSSLCVPGVPNQPRVEREAATNLRVSCEVTKDATTRQAAKLLRPKARRVLHGF
ncbi:hypothetical protein C0Q70_08606 [Pomacea canaliculata]|uniref:Uncharacterized protein n=1 Tax=Pomacea canaliculata TaxID=400727 RepID=A0A2T7PID2_POMCA|nr:hypothetical protein C0Q70_08606 [Pomacea canaliculata]